MKTRIPSLFGNEDGSDEMYNAVRSLSSDDPGVLQILTSGRAFSEELWIRTAAFLDSDLPAKATRQFHQCFWEMYLAATLIDLGLPLVPRSGRKRALVGPDIQIATNTWMEAIAITAGAGPDAVPDSSSRKPGRAYDLPEQQLKLRLIAGVTEKRSRFDGCRQKGVHYPPEKLGVDFVLLHNPTASASLGRGFIRCGDEYWVEGGKLESTKWAALADAPESGLE